MSRPVICFFFTSTFVPLLFSCAIYILPDVHKHITRPPVGVVFPKKVFLLCHFIWYAISISLCIYLLEAWVWDLFTGQFCLGFLGEPMVKRVGRNGLAQKERERESCLSLV